jgi:hypothetical protein
MFLSYDLGIDLRKIYIAFLVLLCCRWGIALDPWTNILRSEVEEVSPKIDRKPLLIINTPGFQSERNRRTLQKLVALSPVGAHREVLCLKSKDNRNRVLQYTKYQNKIFLGSICRSSICVYLKEIAHKCKPYLSSDVHP